MVLAQSGGIVFYGIINHLMGSLGLNDPLMSKFLDKLYIAFDTNTEDLRGRVLA